MTSANTLVALNKGQILPKQVDKIELTSISYGVGIKDNSKIPIIF